MSEKNSKEKIKPTKKKLHTPFAENLRHVLEIRGITQAAVAELAGIAPSVVNNWLSGVVPQDLAAVHKLSRSLGISFEWILLGEGAMEKKNLPTIVDLFDEKDFFDGIIRINAKRLVPKKDIES